MDADSSPATRPRTPNPARAPGIVYLVGAGPGDPGLLTLRGKECLELADVVVYDYLANPQFLSYAKPGAELIYAGKKAGDHALKQGDTNDLLVARAREGKSVTRLKGGDPFVFGRGGEEAEELAAAGIPFEIVPGISSTIAGPAYAGIPVTHRSFNTQLTLFTGHEDPAKSGSTLDYASIARAPGTKVMLMGVERLGAITTELIAAGAEPSTPIALVRWATTPRQEVVTGTLDTIAEIVERAGFKAPAVAVIGGVVTLRDTLRWFDRRPLFGKKVLVTRTRDQAGALSRQLAALGADVIELPTIRIEDPADPLAFGELVQDAHKYEWLVFTSPNGVDRFFTLFRKLYDDLRSIGGVRIAAIGSGTAAKIREYGLGVDLVPEKMTGDGLLEAMLKIEGGVENRMIMVIRPEEVRSPLSAGLSKAGAIVDDAIAYRTVPETTDTTGAQARFLNEGAEVITFASGSAVDHFLALKLPIPPTSKIASIGPVTSRSLKDHGLPVDGEATAHDIPGLVDAVVRLLG